ncbi:MAG: peptidase M19 [Pelagibacteraceae bacterium]|nr:peptidase M19 [Pelagibacteraceae bacterium]
MKNPLKNHIIIDGLQYCNWNRKILEDLWQGGLTAVHVTIVYWENTEEAINKIKKWQIRIKKNKDIITHAKNTDDIIKAKKNNKVAIIFGFQNSAPIENNIFLLEKFYSLGLRFMQLTYNNQTAIGGGCFEAVDSGISRFGYQVIEEMNNLGIIVDLSHAGKKTCLDAIKISKKPVAISHANPFFFHKSKRNIENDVLKKLSNKNGFIGLSLYPYHLKNHNKCKIEDFCQMVKDLINLIGTESIGIGSDLCSNWKDEVVVWMRNGKWTKKLDYGESKNKSIKWPAQPQWFRKGSDIINIYNALIKSGISEKNAIKIMGSNWLNFMKNTIG